MDIAEFTGIPTERGTYYFAGFTQEPEKVEDEKVVEEKMTQEQFNEMMNNYIMETAKKGPSTWSKEARQWAEDNGFLQGDQNGNKQYKKFATREEVVQLLYRLYKDLEGDI